MLVRALGPLQVQPDASAAGRDPDPPSLGGPRQRAVLACLVVHAGEPVAASTVVDAVWPDGAPTTAQGSLQAYVSRLRSVLGRDRLRHVDGAYVLRLEREELDEWVLRDALTDLEQHPQDRSCREALSLAVRLWRGRPLGDLADALFFSAYVAGLDDLHIRALCAAATCCLDAGQPDAAVDLLRPGIVDHPHDEDIVVALMRAYAHAGRADQALGSYRALRDRLRDDLGTSPSARVTELASHVVATEPGASVHLTSQRRHAQAPHVRLPDPTGPFVGRRDEVAAVCRSVLRHGVATLTGPPGIGKTRLAIECGWRLASQAPGGVVLVPLEGVRTAEGVHTALLSACGVIPSPGVPPARALHRALRARQPTLLVIDCADHLDDGASKAVSSVLDSVPSLRALVTSVAVIDIPGQAVHDLVPLTVPVSGGRLLDSEAGRLLLSRARLAQPGFALTTANESVLVEAVRHLDGLPLAIELAAGQLAVLGPHQLLRRLSDRFAVLLTPGSSGRHVSLRAAISSAVDELGPLQHDVLLRLGVLSGPVPLSFAEDLIEDLCAASGTSSRAVLMGLRRRSLVTIDARGASLLESVRDFAADRLRASGDWSSACARHGEVVRSHVAQSGRERPGVDQAAAAQSVRALTAEVQAALRRLPDLQMVALAAAVVPWWYRFGDLADVVAVGHRVFGAQEASSFDASTVLAHAALAEALNGSDWHHAHLWSSAAVAWAHLSGDPRAVVNARLLRGDLRTVVGEWEDAADDLGFVSESPAGDARARAVAELRRIRLEWATGPLTPQEHEKLDRRVARAVEAADDPLLGLEHDLIRAQLLRHNGQLRAAQAEAERLTDSLELLDHRPLAAVARLLLADTASRRGEWEVARLESQRLLRQGSGLAAPFPRDPREVLARCSANEGDLDAAAELCADVAHDAGARGHRTMLAVLAILSSELCVGTDPAEAAAALARVQVADLPIWYRLETALAWAGVHAARGDLERAQRAWDEAAQRPHGHPMLLHQTRLALVAAEIAARRGAVADVDAAVRQMKALAHESGYALPRWERERVERLTRS